MPEPSDHRRDVTEAVIIEPTLQVDAHVRGGRLLIITRPGIVVDATEVAMAGGRVAVRPVSGVEPPVILTVEVSGEIRGGNVRVRPPRRRSGSHWIRTPIPRRLTGGFACAASSSPSDVWAFTGWGLDQGRGTAAALRLTGGRWVVSGRFGVGQFKGIGFVTDCLVLGSKDVWVFGSTAVGPGAGTWHFDGKWALTPAPWFYGASASGSSASNVWAFGASATLTPVLARWNGRSWAENRSFNRVLPRFGSGVLVGPVGLTAVSPRRLYVSAIVEKHGIFSHFVLAWSGRRWSRVGNAAPGYYLPNAVSDGRGGWWTASYPSPGFGMSFLLHESGGRLTRVPLPVPRGTRMVIISLVHVPGTTTVYAAGYTIDSSARLTGVLLSI